MDSHDDAQDRRIFQLDGCLSAYLAAFAKQREYQMVTCNRGFSRWAGLTLAVPGRPAA
jgi:hypothetical protein